LPCGRDRHAAAIRRAPAWVGVMDTFEIVGARDGERDGGAIADDRQ
jgi:hypothetical protein